MITRTVAIDPYVTVAFLQSGRILKDRFSGFDSTKQPFVVSGIRPIPAGQDNYPISKVKAFNESLDGTQIDVTLPRLGR